MKKFFTLLLMCMCSIAAMAASYTGTLNMTHDGRNTSEQVTLYVTANADRTFTITLHTIRGMGNLVISNAVGDNNVLCYDGETVLGDYVWDISFRGCCSAGKYAAFEATLTKFDSQITLSFNNVGNVFQLPNAGFETWTASSGEAQRWHGFKSAKGSLASMAKGEFGKSTDVRPGTTGTYSAYVKSASVAGFVANGTMTNGQLNAGSISPADTKNHSEMDRTSTATDKDGNRFYMACPARPDAVRTWVKFSQAKPNTSYPYATFSAIIYDDTSGRTYYQDPEDQTYSNVVARAKNSTIAATGWKQITVPFNYAPTTASNPNADAILLTVSTNATPGKGSSGDVVNVDDLELVYNAGLSNITYKGGAVTFTDKKAHISTADVPTSADFGFTSTGAGAKSGVIVGETNEGYVAYVYSVSADLAIADVYTITFAAPYESLANVMSNAVENAQVRIAEAIVAFNGDYVHVTDNAGNWLALNIDDAEYKASIEKGAQVTNLEGTLTNVNTNPVLNVHSMENDYESHDLYYGMVDLAHHFTAVPNGIYKVGGYIDGNGKLRAYSGESGEMGQSLAIDDKYISGYEFTVGSYYNMYAIFTINEAWSANAPSKVAADGSHFFDNYLIKPILIDPTIITGIGDVNGVTVTSVRYYNLAGVETQDMQQGVNIVVKTLSNGTTTVEKIFK